MANIYTCFVERVAANLTDEERQWVEEQLSDDAWADEPPSWAPEDAGSLSFD
jgi:hypothetical protein